MKPRIILPVIAILVAALAGCSEKEADVVATADDSAAAIVEDSATPTPSEAPPTTAALGDTVAVGDWEVKVTKVVLNADALIEKANEFNDRPKGQYVLVSFDATYKGAERTADIQSDLTWTLTEADQKVLDEAAAVTPSITAEQPTTARSGGTVSGEAVFDVQKDQLPGALLTVTGYDADFNEVYADFAIG